MGRRKPMKRQFVRRSRGRRLFIGGGHCQTDTKPLARWLQTGWPEQSLSRRIGTAESWGRDRTSDRDGLADGWAEDRKDGVKERRRIALHRFPERDRLRPHAGVPPGAGTGGGSETRIALQWESGNMISRTPKFNHGSHGLTRINAESEERRRGNADRPGAEEKAGTRCRKGGRFDL
jgi:hypothetical protein